MQRSCSLHPFPCIYNGLHILAIWSESQTMWARMRNASATTDPTSA